MGLADQGLASGAPPHDGDEDDEQHSLQLDLHPEQAVWMSQVGHLRQWCPLTRRCCLTVPAGLPQQALEEGLRLLFLFQHLQVLDLTFPSAASRVEQRSIAAVCEVHALRALRILGGTLDMRSLNLGVLSSLTGLHTLSLKPFSNEGLTDVHLEGVGLLTNLRSLSFRGSGDGLTNAGMQQLGRLTGLTQLSVLPVGSCVTTEGVAVLAALPLLHGLTLGLHSSRQVVALREASWVRRLSLVTDDPDVDLSTFFTTLTLCLHTALVSLRLGQLLAPDSTFLISIGTLTHLSELQLGVGLAPGAAPFACDLATLHSLRKLRRLSFESVRRVHLPLPVKLAGVLPLYWPHLEALALSVMAREELQPEAVSLLDNLSHLRSLRLTAPLDHPRGSEAAAVAAAGNGLVGAAGGSGGGGKGGLLGGLGRWLRAAPAAPESGGAGGEGGIRGGVGGVPLVLAGTRVIAAPNGSGGGPPLLPAELAASNATSGGNGISSYARAVAAAADGDAVVELVEVNLSYLPQGLTDLVLEYALVTVPLPAATLSRRESSSSGNGTHHHATPPPSPASSAPSANGSTHAAGAETGHSAADGGATNGTMIGSSAGAALQAADVPPLSRRPLLPELSHLKLSECQLEDGPCCALLRSATRLTHLELIEVRGISDLSVAALRHTAGLRHLVLQTSACGPAPPRASASSGEAPGPLPRPRTNSGGGAALPRTASGAAAAADAGPPPGARIVSNDALRLLAGVDTLQHLQWAVGLGVTAQQLTHAAPVLSALSGLRYLSVFTCPRTLVGAAWLADLRRRLPLCTVSDTAPVLLYNLWDDCAGAG